MIDTRNTPIPPLPEGNRFLRLFHPEGAPARVSIQEVKPGAKIEATDRTYYVDKAGSLRVVGKTAGNKKARRLARRARVTEGA